MHNIALIFTVHRENGRCNSDELYNIIEKVKPEIIFEELSDEVFNQCYVKNRRITLESTTIKKYILSYDIKHIPVDTYEVPLSVHDEFNQMFDALTKDIKLQLFIEKINELEYIYGFPYLNNRYCDKAHEVIQNHHKETIVYLNNQKLTDIYNVWRDYNEKKENVIINNIYDYSKNFEYINAVLLVGAAHRKSMILKINKVKRKEVPKLNWRFFNFNKPL